MHKKIKVVFVINNFLVGGVERLFFDIISYFDKNKFDITIITVFGSGPLESSFRDLGVSIYFASILHNPTKSTISKICWLLIAPITLVRITFFLLKSKPDVVVTSLYQADVLGMIASKITGVKKRILIQHDTVRLKKIKKIIKKVFTINFSTQIVSISNTVKDFMVEYFKVKNDKVITIYNGIDYSKFDKGIKVTFDISNPVIGIVGRLEEIKGHMYALEAFKILKKQHNLDPVVLLAGDGSVRNSLEKYIKDNNLDNIKFLGNVDNIPEFLSQIDILVIPSLSEGFGLVVLEGMVSGKVVVASDLKVMNELIKDGETGLLFKSGNALSLVDVLLSVLKDKKLCEKLQENALSFAEQNKGLFDTKEVSKNYQDLLIYNNY